MNQNTPEVKLENKNDQAQTTAPIQNQNIPTTATPEASPSIKSEENQANWKVFREQREAERKAKLEAERRAAEKQAEADALRIALEATLNKTPQRQIQQDDNEETEEQIIERKVEAAIKQREAQYERQRQEQEAKTFPQKLQDRYTDFNKVCSSENLDYLEYHHPHLAKALGKQPDSFDKWADIYEAIKKYVPNTDATHDMKKIEKNLTKPGSISTSGTAQGTGAMPSPRLTEERMRANYERMQRVMKGVN